MGLRTYDFADHLYPVGFTYQELESLLTAAKMFLHADEECERQSGKERAALKRAVKKLQEEGGF